MRGHPLFSNDFKSVQIKSLKVMLHAESQCSKATLVFRNAGTLRFFNVDRALYLTSENNKKQNEKNYRPT